MAKLTWKKNGYRWYAIAKEGLYTISSDGHLQKFYVTLDLAKRDEREHLGVYATLANAKFAADEDHRAFSNPY